MKYLTLLFVAALAVACNSNHIAEETINADAERLAKLQCEAKKLQEERFQLATDIRMLEDSIMNGTDTILKASQQAKLDELNGEKEDMWLRTKAMAESISQLLEAYHQTTYIDTADRKLLDAALLAKFDEVCK